MNVTININTLIKNKLSANEYIALYLLSLDLIIKELDFSQIYKSLNEKGWLDENNKILKSTSSLFQLPEKVKVSEWINDWLKLWPTFLLPNGYRVSGNTLECKKRMVKFTKVFPQYTSEIITKATITYLKNQEAQNWSYTKKNSKFIFDSETSTLEQECEAIINNEIISTNTVDI